MAALNVCDGSAAERPRPALLLVEDEILIRVLVAEALRAAAYEVIEAANADEAIDILRTASPVDVVITDVRMPGSMDGLDLARTVRTVRPEVRVIVASGHAPSESAAPISDVFLRKPYDPEHLIWQVRSLVAERQA